MTFKILSIDGGGIRGVYPAHILKCFEEKLGINLLESFDMIAGTSTGSIIAAGVACNIRAAEMVNMYKEHGADIFKKKKSRIPFKKQSTATQLMLESVYESSSLSDVLNGVFNDITLGQVAKPLILPATDVGNGGVHVFKSAYDPTFIRDRSVKVRDAVLASCSAPTFFDPHKVNEYLLSDGGLWANNPALVAAIDAQKRLGINYDDIQMVSIGTGHSKVAYGLKHKGGWGFATGWKHKEFINFMLSLQSQSALNYLKLHLKPEQILRIDFESDTDLPLDDVSEIDNLISLADKNFTYGSKEISNFILGRNVL
jgi:patatin-like phospholipase/acyl hydrolase